MSNISLDKLLRQFEITEANLIKIKNNCDKLDTLENSPAGTNIASYSYQDCVRNIYAIWDALPKIDGWKPGLQFIDPTDQVLMRIDAQELGFADAIAGVENQIAEPYNIIAEYGFRLKQRRLGATRKRIRQLVAHADNAVASLKQKLVAEVEEFDEEYSELSEAIEQIDALLGNSFSRPSRWSDLRRHLSFWQLCDVQDIVSLDWPNVYPILIDNLYTEDEPIETEIEDLSVEVSVNSDSPVTTQLAWSNLSSSDFERLVFNLITGAGGYEDAQWLTNTNAPDRGRDISAYRVHEDSLAGVMRQRLIIQCKHWQSKSISLDEIATLKVQMKLWEPPTVDIVIYATSGRFTTDAVAYIEKNNQTGSAPRIEMWPESHLEMLLARNPALIAQFSLKN